MGTGEGDAAKRAQPSALTIQAIPPSRGCNVSMGLSCRAEGPFGILRSMLLAKRRDRWDDRSPFHGRSPLAPAYPRATLSWEPGMGVGPSPSRGYITMQRTIERAETVDATHPAGNGG